LLSVVDAFTMTLSGVIHLVVKFELDTTPQDINIVEVKGSNSLGIVIVSK